MGYQKNVPLLKRFFRQPPCWAVAESEDPLCRVSKIQNKIMKSGINIVEIPTILRAVEMWIASRKPARDAEEQKGKRITALNHVGF